MTFVSKIKRERHGIIRKPSKYILFGFTPLCNLGKFTYNMEAICNFWSQWEYQVRYCLLISYHSIGTQKPSNNNSSFALKYQCFFDGFKTYLTFTFPQMQPSAHAENEKTWQEISDEIKKIFKAAVKLLHEQGKMKHSQAKRYLFSGNFCRSSVH